MSRPNQPPSWIFVPRLLAGIAVFALSLTLILVLAVPQPAQAQGLPGKIIYTFTGLQDGENPEAGLVADAAGNLYGTTAGNNTYCLKYGQCGTVFELSPKDGKWVFNTLHRFHGGNDGAMPAARLAVGPDGSLYGTTPYGGGQGQLGVCQQDDCGIVFKLTPQSDGSWSESIIFHFPIEQDICPYYGQGVILDQAGNLYGTTFHGGTDGGGTVYKLTPTEQGYTYTIIHSFGLYPDGGMPCSGVVMDGAGNLYGTTTYSPGPGGGHGVVYKLTRSDGGWVYTILYNANKPDSGSGLSGVVLDSAGNLYAAMSSGGIPSGGNNCCASGLVFKLTPSNGQWIYSILHHWDLEGGVGPYDSLAVDAAGNVYGTPGEEDLDGNLSEVFKITPQSDGAWSYSDLYFGFARPSGVILAPNGKLYGTTQDGGVYYQGTVFEVAP